MTKTIVAHGLTAGQERFAAAMAKGLSQPEAYLEMLGRRCRAKPATIASQACRTAALPQVRARIAQIIAAARLHDLQTVGEYYAKVIDATNAATAQKNWTAVMQGLRLLGQAHGALHESMTVTVEQAMTDEELLERLSHGDARTAALLQAVMGKPGFA